VQVVLLEVLPQEVLLVVKLRVALPLVVTLHKQTL
jgi:hypothetical protein